MPMGFLVKKHVKVTDYKIILGHVLYLVLFDYELRTNLANAMVGCFEWLARYLLPIKLYLWLWTNDK